MLTNRSNQYNEYNNDKLPRRTALITQQKLPRFELCSSLQKLQQIEANISTSHQAGGKI